MRHERGVGEGSGLGSAREREAGTRLMRRWRVRRVSGPSPGVPDCYDLDVELPLVPLPKPADLMALMDADPDVAKVRTGPHWRRYSGLHFS